ncbi:MAG: YihY/virulence factor BrkB family protein [Fibrobacter sp.]|nr:YihY/virulence factor BrkB family protein [Fibrobacter sp.]
MNKNNTHKSVSHPNHASVFHLIPLTRLKNSFLWLYLQIGVDNLYITAAGIAFFSFIAIFPAIASAISIYGLIADPLSVQKQLSELITVLPFEARQLIQVQLNQIVQTSSSALSWGLVLSIVLSLWTANAAMKAIFLGINIAYNQRETRNFLSFNAITMVFTILAIIVVFLSIALVVILPALVNFINIPSALKTAVPYIRWILSVTLIVFFLALIYHFAPNRANPAWHWVSWGSIIATTLWVIASGLFSYYVNHFGNYNVTYGSLAAVVILLFWFYISSLAILLGAEINSEIELQNKKRHHRKRK